MDGKKRGGFRGEEGADSVEKRLAAKRECSDPRLNVKVERGDGSGRM